MRRFNLYVLGEVIVAPQSRRLCCDGETRSTVSGKSQVYDSARTVAATLCVRFSERSNSVTETWWHATVSSHPAALLLAPGPRVRLFPVPRVSDFAPCCVRLSQCPWVPPSVLAGAAAFPSRSWPSERTCAAPPSLHGLEVVSTSRRL